MEKAAIEVKTKARIPDFRSLEEEAEFWDTHDLTEFEDELEPVEFEIAKPKGLGASTLARMWILEELARARKNAGEAR